MIKVDVKFLVLRVADDKSGLKTCLGLLDLLTPSLLVEILEGSESESETIVQRNVSTAVTVLLELLGEPFHGVMYSLEKMTRPHDIACNRWHVTDNRWLGVVLSILLLDLSQHSTIAVEDQRVLRLQLVLETLPLKDSLELAEKI